MFYSMLPEGVRLNAHYFCPCRSWGRRRSQKPASLNPQILGLKSSGYFTLSCKHTLLKGLEAKLNINYISMVSKHSFTEETKKLNFLRILDKRELEINDISPLMWIAVEQTERFLMNPHLNYLQSDTAVMNLSCWIQLKTNNEIC